MSEIHSVNPTTCGTSVTNVDQHSLAGSTAGHALEGSGRCKRCKRDSHGNSDADSNHNTCSFLCIHVPRRSDDMCCIRHYCVQNSDSFRQQNISLENVTSAEATNRAGKESLCEAGGVAEHAELVSSAESSGTAVCGRSHADSDVAGDGRHAAVGNPGNNGHCEGDDDDEESSNSATSMLRNRKKPRSRLKKFVTSLLSLSSSSSDEEH